MTNAASFRRQFWSGGFYELAIEVGSTDDAALQAVLDAVWTAAQVQGCYGHEGREPEEQEAVPRTIAALEEFGQLLGRVRLPTGELVAFGVTAVRGGDDSSDWLDFGVPLSALWQAGVAFEEGPFERSAATDDWLAALATDAFREAPFSLGLVGWNVSGLAEAALLSDGLPEKRGMGYLLPRDGVLHYGAVND
ncbi:hypothetical protein OG866_37000 [Streptomyces sp. NBC_00663]|uniref:hypothetical protein n=1 Tax=Streptomyces sp. NBC_00663 TaxID=2975801 RepID=UPI002E33C32B|nr:hypothetical protein [Streptomyces sp. NBC_00663]